MQREASSKTTALINARNLSSLTVTRSTLRRHMRPGSTQRAMETKQAVKRRNYTDETQR